MCPCMAKSTYKMIMAGACASVAAFGLGLYMPSLAHTVAQAQAKPATVMASYVEQRAQPQVGALGLDGHILPEADGLYYVDARFEGGVKTRFLVDTGASVTVLTGEDARRLGVKQDASGSGSKLRTAGGTTMARSATIDQMDISGRQLRNIKVAIIDNGLPVSLLGQNALSELGTITLGNGRLRID